MKDYIETLEIKFSEITNGFKEMEKQAKADSLNFQKEDCFSLAEAAYKSTIPQLRMYAVFLFGHLSEDEKIWNYLKTVVSKDDNWRVQEILAKAFDEHCKSIGYQNALNTIDDWLSSNNPNTRRAVTEGLRVWTGRDFFKKNPNEAISRLAALKDDESEYVRKSVGNALRDISKKHPLLVRKELETWNLDNKATL